MPPNKLILLRGWVLYFNPWQIGWLTVTRGLALKNSFTGAQLLIVFKYFRHYTINNIGNIKEY